MSKELKDILIMLTELVADVNRTVGFLSRGEAVPPKDVEATFKGVYEVEDLICKLFLEKSK